MSVGIHKPLGDPTLWRYMRLEELLSILQLSELHFTQLGRFKDPYEGTTPIDLRSTFRGEQIPEPGPTEDERASAGWVERPLDFEGIRDEHARDQFYVSCWHSNSDESAAMWSIYSGTRGVAVWTHLDRLKAALRDVPRDIAIAAVQYLPRTPGLAAGSPWTVKRPSFAHEKEVRAVFRDPELGQRRVSSTLRHPAWEFTDFFPLSFGRAAPAC
jgi:hypothetical protein